jgi:hypothetical protein
VSETNESPEEVNSLIGAVNDANALFDRMAQERHDAGAQKYGPFKFLGANTLEEAMEEVLDLANYARYTFIKLYLMGLQLDEKYAADASPGGFTPSQPSMTSKTPGLYGDK